MSIAETENGKLLVHCHAGCEQAAVIEALQSLGLWSMAVANKDQRFGLRSERLSNRDDNKVRTANALKLWCAGRQPDETLVHNYLRSRGIRIGLPGSIKFHAGLKHPTGSIWPAMISLVTRGSDNRPIGIHRTYLSRGGGGKAPINPNKMMLGMCGGGAVRLAPAIGPLMIGEGIETSLAAMQATGHPVWAALSTSGMRTLELPHSVRDVIGASDASVSILPISRSMTIEVLDPVIKLYCAGRYYLCRQCYRLTHASCNEDSRDRALRRASKIRMRLGGELGYGAQFPPRPKGMWRRTYDRLVEVFIDHESRAEERLERVAANAEPYSANSASLRRYLEAEFLPWYDEERARIKAQPLVRTQALGESFDPDKLERLGRYEVHLDRNLERTLSTLIRLQELRRTKSTAGVLT